MFAIRNKHTNVVWNLLPEGTAYTHNEQGLFCKDERMNAPCPSDDWEIIENVGMPDLFISNTMTYIDGEWAVHDEAERTASLTMSNDRTRAEAKITLIAWIDSFLDPIIKAYPQAEVITWAMQSDYARAVKSGIAAPHQLAFIEGLGSKRGLTGAEMADKILLKATPYEMAVQETANLRSATMKAIDAASAEQIPSILANAQAAAIAKAKAIGLNI